MQIGILLDSIDKNKGNTSELWKTFNEFLSRKSNSTVSLIEAEGVLHTEKSAVARVLMRISLLLKPSWLRKWKKNFGLQ